MIIIIKNNKRILGYDNHERKGHHKHIHNKEFPYNFEDIDKLISDFYKDLKEMVGKNES